MLYKYIFFKSLNMLMSLHVATAFNFKLPNKLTVVVTVFNYALTLKSVILRNAC